MTDLQEYREEELEELRALVDSPDDGNARYEVDHNTMVRLFATLDAATDSLREERSRSARYREALRKVKVLLLRDRTLQSKLDAVDVIDAALVPPEQPEREGK